MVRRFEAARDCRIIQTVNPLQRKRQCGYIIGPAVFFLAERCSSVGGGRMDVPIQTNTVCGYSGPNQLLIQPS
jgi:hypothetical protein